MAARCGTRSRRFWDDTAAEYTSANASSVSPTSRVSRTTHPPASPAMAPASPAGEGSDRPAPRTSSAPRA